MWNSARKQPVALTATEEARATRAAAELTWKQNEKGEGGCRPSTTASQQQQEATDQLGRMARRGIRNVVEVEKKVERQTKKGED